MKINKIYVSFTGQINIGHLALFIELSKDGIFKDDVYIKSKIEGFNTVVFNGDIINQILEVATLINSVRKNNSNKIFILNLDGTKSLSKIKDYKNIILNVNVNLSKTEIDYEERIKEKELNWYKNMESNFIFDIIDTDDVDEVNILVNKFNINKNSVFLSPVNCDDIEKVLDFAKFNGYGFAPDFKRFLWEDKDE